MIRRGDTLVEVLLATVILSIVLASAFTLSNRATRLGQSALERTEVVNHVRDYAEMINYIHSTDTTGFDTAWSEILAQASTGSPQYSDSGVVFCDVSPTLGTSPLYIDFAASDPAGLVQTFSMAGPSGDPDYKASADGTPDNFFATWMEVYDTTSGDLETVDIHIRACGESIGDSDVDRVGAVVRLPKARTP